MVHADHGKRTEARIEGVFQEGAKMLVLSRKVGQEIIMPGANIRITVIGSKGSSVRLGISAPKNVAVHRKEVWDRICQVIEDVASVENAADDVPFPPLNPR